MAYCSPQLSFKSSSSSQDLSMPTSSSFMLDLQDIADWESDIKRENTDILRQPLTKKAKSSHVIDESVKAAEKLALDEIGNVNWVGRLHEYRMTRINNNQKLDPEYIQDSNYSLSFPRFSCAVVIPESTQRFGCETEAITFTAKKPAKHYAAKKAVDWLIENNYMPADGSVQFPKSQRNHSTHLPSPTSPGAISYAAQVPVLCHRLGFCIPRYIVEPVSPASPLYNAYANFGDDPRITGMAGEVRNIYGKKNAKEAVAKILVPLLKNIERLRSEIPRNTNRRHGRRHGNFG